MKKFILPAFVILISGSAHAAKQVGATVFSLKKMSCSGLQREYLTALRTLTVLHHETEESVGFEKEKALKRMNQRHFALARATTAYFLLEDKGCTVPDEEPDAYVNAKADVKRKACEQAIDTNNYNEYVKHCD